MIRVIIVDDEPLAQEVMQAHVSNMPDLELVATCDNAVQAMEILRKEQIDIMYLDINMPQLSGVELIKVLEDPPLVIFTTAHSEHALESYELNAVDYLMKPIAFDRFIKATDKALNLIHDANMKEATEFTNTDDDYIFVKADKKLVRIKYSQVIFIEGLKDYVIIRLDDRRVVTLQTMKSLESKLPSNKFKRIHRSFIVNLKKIESVMGNSIEVRVKGESKDLPIGKNYRENLLAIIQEKRI